MRLGIATALGSTVDTATEDVPDQIGLRSLIPHISRSHQQLSGRDVTRDLSE